MSQIICGQDYKDAIANWVATKIGNANQFHLYEAIGILKDNKIVGGVVIDNYFPGGRCSIHCAGDGKNWLSCEFIYIVFDYIFRQLGCRVIVNVVNSKNLKSIRFTEKIGFRNVLNIKHGSSNGADALIFEMQKSECKWIKHE